MDKFSHAGNFMSLGRCFKQLDDARPNHHGIGRIQFSNQTLRYCDGLGLARRTLVRGQVAALDVIGVDVRQRLRGEGGQGTFHAGGPGDRRRAAGARFARVPRPQVSRHPEYRRGRVPSGR